jgi:hypothetical protein
MTRTKALVFILVLIASWIMARTEGGRIADYGLALERPFRRRFWQGAAIGFAAVRLLGVMHAIGIYRVLRESGLQTVRITSRGKAARWRR